VCLNLTLVGAPRSFIDRVPEPHLCPEQVEDISQEYDLDFLYFSVIFFITLDIARNILEEYSKGFGGNIMLARRLVYKMQVAYKD
jgi:hypothetical protein